MICVVPQSGFGGAAFDIYSVCSTFPIERHRRCVSGSHYAWKSGDLIENLMIKGKLFLGLFVSALGQLSSKCQNTFGIQAGVLVAKPGEGLDQKPGSDEQYHR